ncbi:hypothetical protein ACS0TY_020564 [Phlomoides rotata]
MSFTKDLVFLILQFCDEGNLKRTAHVLEKETGYFFDLKYFEELVLDGNWDEAEKYLSSFTVVEDNKYSTKIYFEIRKQKFLEALDKHEFSVALDILLKDLKVFSQSNKELYKEMAQLMVLDDIRENSSLASYGDTLSARKRLSTGMSMSDQFTPTAVNLGKLSNQIIGGSSNCHDASNLKSINPFDEVASPSDSSSHCQGSADEIPSEFPKTVERILNVGSSVTTMDFHPVLETLLLG